MSRHNFYSQHPEQFGRRFRRNKARDKGIFGIMLAMIGVILLLKTLGVFAVVPMIPVILIFVGLFIGIKTRFRNIVWLIPIIIGLAKLSPPFYIMGHPSREFILPAVFILGGLAIALGRKKHHRECRGNYKGMTTGITSEDTLNIDVTFGGRKEMVTSKSFKGGNISSTFGGCEVNMLQADTTESTIELNVKASFSGIELIVPSHWDIQNEIEPSFASVDDERTMQTAAGTEERKTLILRGTCSFGNIEIKSY